ncbi:MAG TPA: hypothetical protein VGJ44_03395 [Kribbellaceae bacterium]
MSAVVGIAVLSAAGGYGVGELTRPRTEYSSGAAPMAVVTRTVPTTPPPTSPTPTATRSPVPNDKPALVPGDVRFDSQTFQVVDGTDPDRKSRITVDIPRNWRLTDIGHPDWGKFNSSYTKRSVRIDSAFEPEAQDAMMQRQANKLIGLPPDQLVKLTAPVRGTTTADDGGRRTHSTFTYTYLPPTDESLLYVIDRWVSTSGDGLADVEIVVTGLPQDKAALELIMDRATKSVIRKDL